MAHRMSNLHQLPSRGYVEVSWSSCGSRILVRLVTWDYSCTTLAKTFEHSMIIQS